MARRPTAEPCGVSWQHSACDLVAGTRPPRGERAGRATCLAQRGRDGEERLREHPWAGEGSGLQLAAWRWEAGRLRARALAENQALVP